MPDPTAPQVPSGTMSNAHVWRDGDYAQVKGGNVHIFREPFTRWQDALMMACGLAYGRARCTWAPDPTECGSTATPCAQCWEAM